MNYLLVVLSYLLGSTPTSYCVGRWFHGLDLREHGSRNLGATNAFRVMGWRSALPVVAVDIAKGWVPVAVIAPAVAAGTGWTLAFGAAAIVGHMASFWVGFRGGKGVATSTGVFLALAPWAVLGSLGVWLVFALPTGYVSVGSMAAAFFIPFIVAFTPHEGGHTLTIFSACLGALVIWKHRTNIVRLRQGTENGFGRASRARGRQGSGQARDAS